MKITDEIFLRKLVDYRLIQNILGARYNDQFLSYILHPENNEFYKNLKTIIMSSPDFKTLSTYQHETQSNFVLDVLRFGLLTIIDDDDEFDQYSYYNKTLWAHKVNGQWVKIESISKEINNLINSIAYIFKSYQSKTEDKAYYSNKLVKFRGWTFFEEDLLTDNWTISRNTKSIMEQFDLFKNILKNISLIVPDYVEATLNTIGIKKVNWNIRYQLLLDVTDPNIYPNTPIPYDLISGFQFIEWLSLKEKLYEK